MIALYALKSSALGKRYVGITNDLRRRLDEHTSATSKDGQILGPFHLLLTEGYPNYVTARQREKFLKSGKGREWLDAFESSRPASGGQGGAR